MVEKMSKFAKQFHIKFMCLLLLVFLFPAVPGEARTIKVAAVQIPLMVENSEKGLFVDLIREVGRRTKLKFEIVVVPGQRAHKMFATGLAQLLMPFPKGVRKIRGHFTSPLIVKRDFAFVKKGQAIPRSLEDLEGLTLGITKHYTYNRQIFERPRIKLETALTDEINMRKLAKGRIDAFLVEERSGLKARDLSKADDVVYDNKYPIFSAEAVIVTEYSKLGEFWAAQISGTLEDMREDGTYQRIMSSGGES